jgi:MFS family permease
MSKVVSRYYGFQFFFSLLFWVPIFYEYQRRSGLSDLQIFKIQSIYYIVFCFLEIPTGLIADRWGHRRCIRIGAIVLLVCNLLPIFFQSYSGFFWHFQLLGIARSFVSGASTAYLYNYLQENDHQSEFKKIEGDARAYSLIGKVACWAIVGFLMEWHLTLPYWLTAVASALAVVYAYGLPETRTLILEVADQEFFKLFHFYELRKFFKNSPALVVLMIQGIPIFVLGRVCQTNLFQPILSSKSFSLGSFGLIMSAMTIFEAFGSYRHAWVEKYLPGMKSIYILTISMSLPLLFIPFAGKVGTIFLFIVFAYFSGLLYPIQRQVINDAIPSSRHRATLLSIESIFDRMACALFVSMIGSYLEKGRLNNFLYFSSFSAIALMILTYLALQYINKSNDSKEAL